ncbi:hypothetical protein [Sneathiella litorea]|uniref:Antifreeze glycopeptide n=1 Tax=Sneathiella litorea TaxID=2606216 RepID=A0A6L8W4X8_9PROT|nr:hypothetical protein [Sneathiella litorea]MZR29277.1 hypothetical protein [Sneathiella litorea]
MTSSLNRSRLYSAGLLVAGLAVLINTASAQEKPRNLVPQLGQPATQLENAPDTRMPTTSAPQKQVLEGSRIEGSVVVQSLGGLSPASIGTLTAANGGLGTDMWQGTPTDRVPYLLKYMPISASSPEMQSLYRRLLLTGATLPQEQGQSTEILELRLEKLMDAGLVTDASVLISRVPASSMTPDLNRISAELLLLKGENEQACRILVSNKAAAAGSFWTKADVFCNIVAGNMARAELGISLLYETAGEDTLFFALFDRLAGGKSPLPETGQALNSLHFAMMRLAKVSLPIPLFETAGNEFLWALAMDQSADLNERFVAAYKLLAVGGVPPLLPRQLVSQGALLEGLEDRPDLARIATLYREATSTNADTEMARLLGEIWAAGDRNGSYFAASSLSMPLLSGLTPAEFGDSFELDALRLSLVAKESATAALWERAVRRGALRGDFSARETARKFITRADAYMLISGTTGIARWNAASFNPADFDHAEASSPGENAGLYLAILETFGEPVPEDLWGAALELGQEARLGFSNFVLEKNLQKAAEAGLVGETVALSLAALGKEGPGKASTETLKTVLAALKAIGLEAEARQIALEAAVSRNL